MGDLVRTKWVPMREADRIIAGHHRHHDPMQGGIVALGLWKGDTLIGAGVIGRPVSRHAQAKGWCEFIRVCVVEGNEHMASLLLARTRRVAAALGFERAITYTLPSEGGASLRADGWTVERDDNEQPLLFGGGEWDRPGRPRAVATAPTERKWRWWHELNRQPDLMANAPLSPEAVAADGGGHADPA